MRQGGMFSFLGKRTSPLTPPKRKGRGAFPLDPAHWQFVARRAARAAQCRCGVHGFAMNPCESLPLSTTPYYREARVTFARRQTACGMRHCCARRIVETGGRWKLGCTSTRLAERHPQGVCRIRKAAEPPTAAQQRMIGAEVNRLAEPLAASEAIPPRRHFHSGGTKVIRARDCQSKPFSWGSKGAILFCERESPL